MHKNTLWFIVAILCIYFSLVLCENSTTTAVQELESKDSHDLIKRSDITDLEEEGRTRRRHRHHLWYSHWGWYGLAIAYLVKIKVVVVAFFVGSAIYLGLRHLWPHKCGGIGGIYKEGNIVLDHPPSFAHYDHIPYSLDHDHYHDHDHHHYDSTSFSSGSSSGPTSFEPYSAYSSNSFTSDGPPEGFSSDGPPEGFSSDGPPEGFSSDGPPFRHKRSVAKKSEQNTEFKTEVKETLKTLARQMVISEEQIGEFMFGFLGLDTNACRRRFICEMEFKSKANPLTSMAFRVIGRAFFTKYTNDQNPNGKANNFGECAAVNSECVFIENNEEPEPESEPAATEQDHNEDHTVTAVEEDEQSVTNVSDNEVTTEDNNSLESNDIIEKENEKNLKAELRRNSYRRRLRGDRYLKLL